MMESQRKDEELDKMFIENERLHRYTEAIEDQSDNQQNQIREKEAKEEQASKELEIKNQMEEYLKQIGHYQHFQSL